MEKSKCENIRKVNSWVREDLPSAMSSVMWRQRQFRPQKLWKKLHSLRAEQNRNL